MILAGCAAVWIQKVFLYPKNEEVLLQGRQRMEELGQLKKILCANVHEVGANYPVAEDGGRMCGCERCEMARIGWEVV